MSKLDTIARRSALELHANFESSPIPRFDPSQIGRYRVKRVVRTVAMAFAILLVLLLPALILQIVEDDVVTPVTTDTTTPETDDPESLVWPTWPTVVARDFLHRPSGAVGGVPISFPDPMWCGCSLVTLHDGRVLMVGSGHSIGYAAHIWDPDTEQWTATGRPNTGWYMDEPKTVLMDDGRVLALFWNQLEFYDPAEGSFRSLTHQSELVRGSVPVVMTNGRVLLATSPRSGWVFDPDGERFTSVGSAISGANVVAAMALPDGRVLILGEAQASVYDPDTDEFTAVRPVYPPGPNAALALLDDGRVLLTGGSSWEFIAYPDDLNQASAAAQVFDPTIDRFTAVASMLQPRSHHSAVTMADGRVVVLGGAGALVEVFDPEKGIFEPGRELSSPRLGPSVTKLHNGSLLVVGGSRNTIPGWMITVWDPTTFRTAEIYDLRPNLREPAEARLSGFTLGLEVEIPSQPSPPDSGLSLVVVVPPRGLEGAVSLFARWELTDPWRGSSPDEGVATWIRPDGRVWGPGTSLVRQLPVDCEQGCTIREPIFQSEGIRGGTTLGLTFHIQYEGGIPGQAHGITLTIVDSG